MAFEIVTNARAPHLRKTDEAVTVGLYLGDGKEFKTRSLAFRITRPLITKLGWLEQDKRIALFEGTGSDAGFLQLMPHEFGRYTPQIRDRDKGGQGFSISITAALLQYYTLNEDRTPSRPTPHIVEGNALIIECPSWLVPNPLTQPKMAEPTPLPFLPPAYEQKPTQVPKQQPPATFHPKTARKARGAR